MYVYTVLRICAHLYYARAFLIRLVILARGLASFGQHQESRLLMLTKRSAAFGTRSRMLFMQRPARGIMPRTTCNFQVKFVRGSYQVPLRSVNSAPVLK